MAWEQIHGPLLIHERIDFGFAMLATVVANLWSKRRYKVRHFLPPWYEIPEEDTSREAFERLLRMAEESDSADNLHVDR